MELSGSAPDCVRRRTDAIAVPGPAWAILPSCASFQVPSFRPDLLLSLADDREKQGQFEMLGFSDPIRKWSF